MAESASAAGLVGEDFDALLQGIADDPDRAFEDLRELLFDATRALTAAANAEEAHLALTRFDGHRLASLLHHYELSNWVLFARAYAKSGPNAGTRAREVDRALREAPVALDWLTKTWLDAR
jgi:hypothetical protein